MSLQVIPRGFSATHSVLNGLLSAEKKGTAQAIGAHLVAPVAVIGAQILTVVVHAAGAVIKTACLLPRAALYALTLGKFDPLSFAKPADALEHVKRVIVGVPLTPVAGLISLFSISGAISAINAVGAGHSSCAKAAWLERFKSADWKGKFKLVCVETPKEAFYATKDKVQHLYHAAKDKGVLKYAAIAGAVVGAGAAVWAGDKYLNEGAALNFASGKLEDGWKAFTGLFKGAEKST